MRVLLSTLLDTRARSGAFTFTLATTLMACPADPGADTEASADTSSATTQTTADDGGVVPSEGLLACPAGESCTLVVVAQAFDDRVDVFAARGPGPIYRGALDLDLKPNPLGDNSGDFLDEPYGMAIDDFGLSVLVGRRVSMHVLMQPVILRGLMADPLAQGQGWIARTLIAEPRSLAGSRLYRADQVAADKRPEVLRYHAALCALLAETPAVHPEGDGCELTPRPMLLDQGAQAVWIEFYDEVERQQADGAPLAGVRAWASKAAEHAARIAAVVTLMADPVAAEVPADAMAGAIEITSFYLGEHVRLMGQSVVHLHQQRLRDLLAWLQEKGPRVKRSDVLQFTPRALRDLKAEGINPMLAELERRAYLRSMGDAWEVRRA